MQSGAAYRSCAYCESAGELWRAPRYGEQCPCCDGDGGHWGGTECMRYKPIGKRPGPRWRASLPNDWIPPSPEESPAVAYLDDASRKTSLDKIRSTRRRINSRREMTKRLAFVEDVDRSVVWQRDQGVCGICGLPADPDNWHLDHVIPLSRGGEHSYANTRVSHPPCNIRKRDRLDAEMLDMPTYSPKGR